MAHILKGSNALIWPLVVLAIAFGAFWLKPWQTKPTETISVTAEGKAEVTPNIAKINATITSKNPNLDQARQENETKVSQIIVKLKELGVEEKDIQTQQISSGRDYEIQPQTITFPPPIPFDKNQFSTSLEIVIRNFEISDEVISTLTKNGVSNIYGPNLTVSDEKLEEGKTQARGKAVESARTKAEQLAKLSGGKLGKAVSIKEQGDFGYPVPILARGEADLKEKASLIQPGQNEVTISLAVDFALK